MSAIDDVIQRARQPGGFVERKRFTVARSRAIEKLRKFALPDPHFYILELIQAAVANGAQYVDIDVSRARMILSYVGGGFTSEELGQLFDFLFASKEQLEFADVRQLALGINALLLFSPRDIVIESGDGTIDGTTRVRIDGRTDAVEVGKPEQALRGTYVTASGMKHRAILAGNRVGEQAAIESRCLTAPVPVVVNAEPLFGWGAWRSPRLCGYQRWLGIDEGDLYGSIGIPLLAGDRHLKVAMWGVWVDTIAADILPGTPIGGIVAFDRLHKTADHAAVVQDERLFEMLARLKPYARRLQEGKPGAAVFDIWLPDGTMLTTRDLRRVFQQSATVVVVTGRFDGTWKERARRAEAIGSALGAPVLVTGRDDVATLRLIGGTRARIVQPDIDDDTDAAFYRQKPAAPPARPWLVSPIALDPLPVAKLAEALAGDGLLARGTPAGQQAEGILVALGAGAEVRATIYAPERATGNNELRIDVLTTDRLLWSEEVSSAFPGLVLRVDLPDVSPKLLLRPWPGTGASVACIVGRAVARAAVSGFEAAVRRVLASLGQIGPAPGSTASRIGLAALARSAVKRLRTDAAGDAHVRFSLLDPDVAPGILDVPLLGSLDGRAWSARDLEASLDADGLVYGVVPGAPRDLKGLDASRILDLDPQQERMLIAIVGEASYVRVDARDVIAEADGVRCRDVAVGLRAWPDFPLLVEGIDPSRWSPAERARCERRLVERLIRTFAEARDEEPRRQAARHLLWHLHRKVPEGDGWRDEQGVRRLPLFLDADGRAVSFEDVRPLLCGPDGVPMHDGWSADAADLGPLGGPAPAAAPAPGAGAPFRGLAMNPFVLRLLARIGRVRPVMDFDLTPAEAVADPAPPEVPFVAEVRVDAPIAEGVVGVPVTEVADPAIAVVDVQARRVGLLRDLAREAWVVGHLRLRGAGTTPQAVELLARRAVSDLMEAVARRIPALAPDSPEYERCLRSALWFASRKVAMTAAPDGRVLLDVLDPAAERILDLPLFPTTSGVATSAARLLRERVARRSGDVPEGLGTPLADRVPPWLWAWLEGLLSERRIARPASAKPVGPELAAPPARLDDKALAAWLTDSLARLRPDGATPLEIVVSPFSQADESSGGRLGLAVFAGPEARSIRLAIDGSHWLVRRARQRMAGDPEAGAWLLLACFAHLNAALEGITNQEEQVFQEHLMDLLERGELLPPAP